MLWVIEKSNRIAVYQQIFEETQDHLDALVEAAESAGTRVPYREFCRCSDPQLKIPVPEPAP